MKKMIYAGIGIFSIGIIIVFCTLLAVGFDFDKISTDSKLEMKQKVIDDQNQLIKISDDNVSFSIKQSIDDKIHFEYYESDIENYDINYEKDKITFIKNSKYNWFNNIFKINLNKKEFIVYLPLKYKGSLDIITKNGDVDINNITAEDIALSTSNGNMYSENITASNFLLNTSNGDIETNNVTIEGNCILKTINGKLNVNKLTSDTLDAVTSNSNIKAENITTNGNVSFKSANGHILFLNLLSKSDINIQTSNGKISGNIVGKISDFSIRSKTSNAKNSLPESVDIGFQSLEVITSNGDIAVEFIK